MYIDIITLHYACTSTSSHHKPGHTKPPQQLVMRKRASWRALSLAAHMLSTTVLALCLLTTSRSAFAEDSDGLSGHVDLASKYVLRGMTSSYGPSLPGGNKNANAPESEQPVLQWGLDWTHASGFYLGYWASQINYSYKQLGDAYRNREISDFQKHKSIENDFYTGYQGKLGELGYNLGLTAYYYINSSHSNALETKLGIDYGAFSLVAQTLLKDVVWGNSGDTYWTLNYSQPWDYGITFSATLGFNTYVKEGKFLGSRDTMTGEDCAPGSSFFVTGCVAGKQPISSGFRHLTLGFNQTLFKSGINWGLQAIVGGENRFGVKQDNRVIATLGYAF